VIEGRLRVIREEDRAQRCKGNGQLRIGYAIEVLEDTEVLKLRRKMKAMQENKPKICLLFTENTVKTGLSRLRPLVSIRLCQR